MFDIRTMQSKNEKKLSVTYNGFERWYCRFLLLLSFGGLVGLSFILGGLVFGKVPVPSPEILVSAFLFLFVEYVAEVGGGRVVIKARERRIKELMRRN